MKINVMFSKLFYSHLMVTKRKTLLGPIINFATINVII
jgi:hypothetical protein